MKKEITLKKAVLLIAILLWGVMSANATLYKVGATGTNTGTSWTTIAGAYGAIPATPDAGGDTIEIQGDYESASETYPITLGAKSGADATHYIVIKPANGVKKTIGPANQTVIYDNLSFSSGVTTLNVPGTNGVSAGMSVYGFGLNFLSTPYRFYSVNSVDAVNNTITLSDATTTTSTAGKKTFVGPSGKQAIMFDGAKYVTIDGVSRTDLNTGLTIQNPNSINAQTIYFKNNATYNTIQNCIVRGANVSGVINNGYDGTIYFGGGQYNTIKNNDVCDMDDPSIPYPICALQMVAGGGTNNNNTVSNNNIYNISNLYSPNGAHTFMQFGSATSANNWVLNNKFYWTDPTSFTTASINFFNCGTLSAGNRFEGNTVGYSAADGTGTSDLTFLGSGGTIVATPNAKYFTCKNNTISNIKIISPTGGKAFVSMQIVPTGTASADNCYGNTIQNIELNSNGGNGTLYGIFVSTTPTYNLDIKNNIIKNLTCQSTGTTYTNTIYGIQHNFGASGTIAVNCTGNEISNLTAGSSGSSANQTILGIMNGGCANTIEKNLIYNLKVISSGTGSVIKGMRFGTSKTDGCTIKNNIIRLGTGVSSDVEISAIINEGLSNNTYPFNIYHNSIYIGGTSQTKPSHCLSRTTTATSGLISIQNNIFSNKRSGGSAVNQIYNLYAATDITTSDHNLYEYGSLYGTVTTTSPTTYSALSNWISAKPGLETGSIDQTSPQFMDATATIPDLRIIASSAVVDNVGADLSSTVTDDYDGKTRSGYTPHDIGAFAYTKVASASDASLANHRFRTHASGDWRTNATWESSADGTIWIPATAFPSATANSITILNGHTVTAVAEATASTLTINGGGKLTLNDRVGLSATNFTLQSDATNGTGTFVDLNTTGGLTVSGTTTVNQNLSSYRSWYMSSPVAGAQPVGMNRIKYYNESDNSWPVLYNSGVSEGQTAVPYNSNSFETGRGYLVVPDADDTNIQFTAEGEGKLNTGVKEIILKKTVDAAATKSGFNLIGNPYPSYLDWTAVYAANADKFSDATMWYRTKVETLTPGVYEYKFWTVNGEGVGSVDGATKEIPPMQAFWVRSNANNNVLTLNKDMRSHAPSANKLLKAPASINNELPLVRLQVNNGANTDEAVIYFSANASDGRDAYDAPKMSNENTAIPEIYTVLGTEHLVINGMNSIPVDQEIGLGFEAGNAASFSLKAIEVRNLPANVKLILKDKVTNAETDITDGVSGYEFTPLATSDTRFSVIFRTTGAVTGIDKHNDGSFNVYSNQKNQITVLNNHLSGEGSVVSVYNAVGQKLLSKQITGSVTMIEGNFTAGVYVVKVNNTSMKVIVK